jgi:thiamine biosynthesis lipoprotein
MSISRRVFLTSCLAAGAFAFVGRPRHELLHQERWYLFGTLVDVAIADPDRARVARALAGLSAEMKAMHRDWHAWKPGMLGEVNAAIARGGSAAVSPALAGMIEGIKGLHRESDGIFNPAIGDLVGLWGFHEDVLPAGPLPERWRIERLLAEMPSPADLTIKDGLVSSRNPSVQLDLGGYAKGYGLDMGMALLERAGIRNAVLNAGGDVLALGEKGPAPWRIGIRHPQGRGTIAWLESSTREAVFTSGNYERYREDAGARYPHILDPRTGMPVTGIASATVVHADGALADAAATALVVAGPDRWQETAGALGIDQAMVVNADGSVLLTGAMAQRTTVQRPAAAKVAVV